MQLYDLASEGIVDYMPRSYAVWPTPSEEMRGAWQGINLELIDQPPVRFCQGLAKRLMAVTNSTPSHRVSRSPYKFLDYYRTEDAEIFHGRTTESQVVFRMVFAHRLLTLFGPSGAGKTSLLLAGVVPRLATEDYQHVYVRVFDEPLLAVREAVVERVGGLAEDYSGDLRAFLEATLAPTDRLIIILDQFEELFLRVGSEARQAFFRELAAAMDQPKREVRFICCLREDYLARLDEARPYLPDVLANSYRLIMLDSGGARIAITEPALLAGVIVEPSLVDALVGASAGANMTQEGDLVEADVEGTGRHIPPAAVQIVMEHLYRAALPPNHPADAAPPAGLKLTLEAYRAIRYRPERSETGEELYGAKAILAGYVRKGLAQLADLMEEDGETPVSADSGCGEKILKALVTSQGTKVALTS